MPHMLGCYHTCRPHHRCPSRCRPYPHVKLLHRINLNVAGGVENQFCAFLAHPRVRERLRNQVLIGEPVHPDLAPHVRAYTEAVHSFKRWHGLPLPRRPRALRAARTIAVIGACRPDALLSWSAFAKPELAVGCRQYGVPLVYREGGAAWGEPDPAAVRAFLEQTAGAVCNTHASKRMLQLKWGYRGPARICLGGIRPDVLDSAPSARRLRDGEPVALGSAARLVGVKGVALSLHALAVLRDEGVSAVLRVAGDGPDRTSLAALAARLGLAESVHFLGGVRDMRSFYRDIDILLHPALREPLGNVCIEAAANGCVVVATRVDGLAETVLDGVTGVSLPAESDLSRYRELGGNVAELPGRVYDPDSDALRELRCVEPRRLAEAVASLVADPERFATMSAAAITEIRARFAFDRYVEDMVEAIGEFASVPGGRA